MNRSRIDQITRKARGFSLVELLVVIFIIAVLIGLLIPAISKVRQNAQRTDTQQFVTQLSVAIENYQSEFRAYPGPLTDDQIYNANNSTTSFTPNFTGVLTTATNFDTETAPQMMARFTQSENLVLGLLGGLKLDMTAPANPKLVYDPSLVGGGPNSLNPANPKRFNPYFDAVNLSWRDIQNASMVTVRTGKYEDGAGFADDTIIPEFVDRFPEPMPILYLRAKRGVAPLPPAQTPTAVNNSVISYVLAPTAAVPRTGTYDISQVISYTGAYEGDSMTPTLSASNATPPSDASRSIGIGKRPSQYMKGTNGVGMANSNWYHGLRTVDPNSTLTAGANYANPFDAYSYFQNPASPNSARNKDTYILISAGVDRIYGTRDDVVSFGTVGE